MSEPIQLTFADAVGKYQHTGQAPTSRAAAVQELPATGSKRAAVYQFVLDHHEHGATDEEIQTGLDMNPSTERPRRVELVEQGLLVDSGRTRLTRSRRSAVVWVAV